MPADIQIGPFLGIECGATRSVALCGDANPTLIARYDSGPANLRLVNDSQLRAHFRAIKSKMPMPAAVCIGMAGARNPTDLGRIERAAGQVWPGIPCHATNDLETALMAAQPHDRTGTNVLVLSGTGSCCFGRARNGRTAKIGGWGHILGDKGSGFEIGLRALKAVVYYYDRDGVWPELGSRLLRALQLNEPDALIDWVRNATKTAVAALAQEVFKAAEQRDKIAGDILKGAAHSLAADAAACAKRLTPKRGRVNFVFAGSILLKQRFFRKQVASELRRAWPNATIAPLEQESAWGAVILARDLPARSRAKGGAVRPTRGAKVETAQPAANSVLSSLDSLQRSPTEQRNPHSMRLDKMSITRAVTLMVDEDARIRPAILKQRRSIEQAVRAIVRSFKSGGRLFYAGAGTSGRLGVLDASECPPTFRTDPQMVQGIMAGGQRALWEAVEGAEDDPEQGAAAVQFRKVQRRDVLVGIAASGRTPFVWGALAEARKRGATTILLTFNPFLKIAKTERPNIVIAPNVGPEVLTGSTRLKAGTATKLILNILTTVAMVQLGKVSQNLMVDVNASNSKLRDRAIRILQELSGSDYGRARRALEQSHWQIRAACRRLSRP